MFEERLDRGGLHHDEERGPDALHNRRRDRNRLGFMQRDPLGYVDGNNLYAILSSNPIIYVDPYGTDQAAWNQVRSQTDRVKEEHSKFMYWEVWNLQSAWNKWDNIVSNWLPANNIRFQKNKSEDPTYNPNVGPPGILTWTKGSKNDNELMHELTHAYNHSINKHNPAKIDEAIGYAIQYALQEASRFQKVEQLLEDPPDDSDQLVRRIAQAWSRAWGTPVGVIGPSKGKRGEGLGMSNAVYKEAKWFDDNNKGHAFRLDDFFFEGMEDRLGIDISCNALASRYNEHPTAIKHCLIFVCINTHSDPNVVIRPKQGDSPPFAVNIIGVNHDLPYAVE